MLSGSRECFVARQIRGELEHDITNLFRPDGRIGTRIPAPPFNGPDSVRQRCRHARFTCDILQNRWEREVHFSQRQSVNCPNRFEQLRHEAFIIWSKPRGKNLPFDDPVRETFQR